MKKGLTMEKKDTMPASIEPKIVKPEIKPEDSKS